MDKNLYAKLEKALVFLYDQEKAIFLSKYFKTGKGEYAEGDVMLGVSLKEIKTFSRNYYKDMNFDDFKQIMQSKYHDMRRLGLEMLVLKYQKSKTKEERQQIVKAYLENIERVNNWDLVDCSSYKILGAYTFENQDSKILFELSCGDIMWKRRIAVVSTLYWIKENSFEVSKKIIYDNLEYKSDLMHKANGWMLREIGKRNEKTMLDFVYANYDSIPRTTLRYAIEKLEKPLYQKILNLRKNVSD